jgi:hypothetical protein
MPRMRWFLGLLAAGLAGVALWFAVRDAFVTTKMAIGLGTPALILPGLLAPLILVATASVFSRIAYRILFWRRYVERIRRANAGR